MKQIKKVVIDKCYEPRELYRYNIEFEDKTSAGSCFCYGTFKEAYLAIELAIKIFGRK
jgi:hypothetical protein